MIEIKLKKESSPIGFDLALTSIDNKGNLGRLNEFVISQKGLPIDLIPNPKILEFGYSQAVVPETKERIGFVVTIGHDKTFDLLKRNFSKAVSSLNEQHKIRSIWIPLMGTGAGGLDYRRSFEAIIPGLEILKNIKRNFQLEISLPSDIDLDTEHWISNKIEFIINNREKETAKEQSPEFITNRSFYAVGHFFDGTENQLPRFINDSIWENGYEEKQTNTVNKVEQGDILILKSTNTKGLFVKAIGIVIDNAENGHLLYVNWVQIEEVFLEGLNAYQYTIRRIVENVDRLLNGLNEKVENLPEIIDKLTSFKPTSINWKYFSKKYQSIQESFEFEYSDAQDRLIDLQNFSTEPVFKSIEEIRAHNSIEAASELTLTEELYSFWDKNQPKTALSFQEFLKHSASEELSFYFTKLTDFLYLLKLNLIESTQPIKDYFEYVQNGYKFTEEQKQNALYYAISYLTNPMKEFDIYNSFDRNLISKNILKKEYSPVTFNADLLAFGKRGLTETNDPRNFTHLLSTILFDSVVQAIWLNGNVASNDRLTTDSKQTATPQKAPFDNDGLSNKEDLLDIIQDVQPLAMILAAKEVSPPIAMALFGRWGSGKSFFMEALEDQVRVLSENQSFDKKPKNSSSKNELKEQFCCGVAHIHFNAWSYLDSNLWAGLVSKIFEGLDEYITGYTKADKAREVENKILGNLEVLAAEKEALKAKQKEINDELELDRKKWVSLKRNHDGFRREIKNDNLEKIKKVKNLEYIKEIKSSLKNQLAEYGVPEDLFEGFNPNEVQQEINSFTHFVSRLFKRWNIAWLALIILVIIFVGLNQRNWLDDIFDNVRQFTATVIGVIVPFIVMVVNTLSKYKKLINPFRNLTSKLNTEITEEQAKFERRTTSLKIKIKSNEQKLNQLKYSILNKEKEVEKVNSMSKTLVSKKAFDNYISEKVSNKSYDEYLGIISLIRRDFEILSELFGDFKNSKKLNEKEKKDAEEINELFEEGKQLDRIILYIDDLDRCSDEKVLEVIQAVHLLMAFPLFNVVVGVDIRCVKNALIYKNLNQYHGFNSLKTVKKEGISIIKPEEYLEKIFQIPFHLEEPTENATHIMIDSLTKEQVKKHEQEVNKISTPSNTNSTQKSDTNDKMDESHKNNQKTDDDNNLQNDNQGKKKEEKRQAPTDLHLSKSEAQLLKDTAWMLGGIPRTIKRFVNLYRLIKAHENIDDNSSETEQLSVMFLLGLNIGAYKSKALDIIDHMKANPKSTLSDSISDLNKDLNSIMKTKKHGSKILGYENEDFIKHMDLINRFSFLEIYRHDLEEHENGQKTEKKKN